MPPATVFEMLVSRMPFIDIAQSWPEAWETILWQLRLPRIVLAALVGVALATSGATYQGLFRNPLADPYLIGVASGAGLGATVVLVTEVPLYFGGVSLLPVAAFAGAITAVTLAYVIARQSEGLPLTTLILAGVAIGSVATAVTSLLMIRSEPDLRPVLSWLLGGFISAEWKDSLRILPYLVPSLLLTLSYARILNVLQLDEEHALQLGVNVERTKVLLIGAATLSTAAAVSFSGIIGFVGLIAPHAVRLMWGGDYRFLLPMAAIVGAAFLIVADLVARTVASPAELPVGVITALCGAPFFLYLLRGRRAVAM
jgi:iron complex transport system permease protein